MFTPNGAVLAPVTAPAATPVVAPAASTNTTPAAALTPKPPVAATTPTVTAPVATTTSPVTISGISTEDQEAFDTLNLYRTDPAAALADVKAEKLLFNKQGYLAYPGEIMMATQEGTKVYDDAITFL